MGRLVLICALWVGHAIAQPHSFPGEEPVAPYAITEENAGAAAYPHDRYFKDFGGQPAIDRVVNNFAERIFNHAVIGDIFFAADPVRFRRTLSEQFCFILGGPCTYTGRDMRSLHEDHGITRREFNLLVVELQEAMSEEGIGFSTQNKLTAKLAPMMRDIVTR